jgi:hypothetical protein
MAFQQGGASTPSVSANSGSAVTPNNLQPVDYGKAVSGAINGAMAANTFVKDQDQKDSVINLNKAALETESTKQELNKSSAWSNRNDAALSSAKEDAQLIENQAATAERDARIKAANTKSMQEDWNQSMMKFDNVNRRIKEGVGTIRNATSAIGALSGTGVGNLDGGGMTQDELNSWIEQNRNK